MGTPAYIAPEVLLKKEYDGKVLFYQIQLYMFIMLLYRASAFYFMSLSDCILLKAYLMLKLYDFSVAKLY